MASFSPGVFFPVISNQGTKSLWGASADHVVCSICRTYNQLWAEAQLELSRLLAEELSDEPRHPEKDRVVFFQRLAMLYVRYIQIYRQLEEVYDQVVHPQKRRVIRGILEGVMGRVLELKNEMVEKEFSEYHYMDDVLHDLKLTPVSVSRPVWWNWIAEMTPAKWYWLFHSRYWLHLEWPLNFHFQSTFFVVAPERTWDPRPSLFHQRT